MRDDLRRRALESKKTVSRKARSRGVSQPSSRTASAQSSRQSSRHGSRHPSDDEETESLSDGTAWSTASVDDFPGGNDEDLAPENDRGLDEVINEIVDRKRSSVQGREGYLFSYNRILTSHHMADDLDGKLKELLPAFAKSIKSESSERETCLALRAVGLTAVTTMDGAIYPSLSPTVRRTISDSSSTVIKAAAIHCLGACTVFGGAGEDSIADQMDFLMEIIASDGNSVDAPDDADTVTAALEEWGFLAAELEDLEQESEDAIETFIDQLESSSTSVQIAAGENIALLYEKSYTPQEEGEALPEDEEENAYGSDDDRSLYLSDDEDNHQHTERLIKRYNAYHNTPRIINQVESLAHISGRHINKKDKRSLHTNFTSILNTVINPRRGPQYSNAIDSETDRQYGSRKAVKFHQNSYMVVDRWWKWMRLAALRRLLQGGFVAHYFEGNGAVLDSLPVLMRPFDSSSKSKGGKKGGKRKTIASFD